MSTVDEKLVNGGALKAALAGVKTQVAGLIKFATPMNATSNKVGLVKPGEHLSVDTDGALSVDFKPAEAYTDQKISDLIGGAPSTLDTLKEIAEYLDNDKDGKAGLVQQIAKVNEKAVYNAGEVAELKAAGYTTEAALLAKYPKLSSVVSTADLGDALKNYVTSSGLSTTLNGYATKTELNGLSTSITSAVDNKLESYVKASDLDALAMTAAEAQAIVGEAFAVTLEGA